MLADRYQVVTLTGGQVVRGLTYLKVVRKHVVVDDAGRPYHPDTLSDFLRELRGAAKVRQIRLHDASRFDGLERIWEHNMVNLPKIGATWRNP
jgi:hypothetical protein